MQQPQKKRLRPSNEEPENAPPTKIPKTERQPMDIDDHTQGLSNFLLHHLTPPTDTVMVENDAKQEEETANLSTKDEGSTKSGEQKPEVKRPVKMANRRQTNEGSSNFCFFIF